MDGWMDGWGRWAQSGLILAFYEDAGSIHQYMFTMDELVEKEHLNPFQL